MSLGVTRRFIFALAFALVATLGAQSPDEGHVVGSAYVNSYFHVSYSWPKILQPYDMASLQLPQKSRNANEFLLFSARQGDEPFGVVIVAEKLNVQTPHSTGIKDAADMMGRISRFRPEQHVVILARRHFTSANGLVFDELDYTENGGYSAAVLTTIGQHLIVFKCNAKSAVDLADMTKSTATLQVSK